MTTSSTASPNDPLSQLPGYLLRRASTAVLTELNLLLKPLKLRHADAAFLLLIASSPGMTQSNLGRILDIQRANMAPLVARLEKRGLLDRQRVDGRSQALALTAKGRDLEARARAVVTGFEASLFERVPPKMRPMVLPILMALWNPTRS